MTGALRVGVNRKAAAVGALVVLRKPLNVEETCAQFEKEFHARAAGEPKSVRPTPAPESSGDSAESMGRL
jgi:hypothetical protein